MQHANAICHYKHNPNLSNVCSHLSGLKQIRKVDFGAPGNSHVCKTAIEIFDFN